MPVGDLILCDVCVQPPGELVTTGLRGRLAHWDTVSVFNWLFFLDGRPHDPNVLDSNGLSGLRYANTSLPTARRPLVPTSPLH